MSHEPELKPDITPLVVFISYKWSDEAANQWVEQLARDLRKRGIDALLDKWEVRLGESFSDYMTSAIHRADAFLLVITEQSLAAIESEAPGGAVKFEVQLATARRIAGERFRFIGILREGERPPRHLRDARYIDFRSDAYYDLAIAELVSDLMGLTGKPALPTVRDLDLRAESLLPEIWRGLPHGNRYLLWPIHLQLQERVITKLIELVTSNSDSRGYSFYILEAEVEAFEPGESYHRLEDALSGFMARVTAEDEKPIDWSEVPFKLLHVPTNRGGGTNRLVLIVRLRQWRGEDTEDCLHGLRALLETLYAYRMQGQMMTVIFLASEMKFEKTRLRQLRSPWNNIFQSFRLDIEK